MKPQPTCRRQKARSSRPRRSCSSSSSTPARSSAVALTRRAASSSPAPGQHHPALGTGRAARKRVRRTQELGAALAFQAASKMLFSGDWAGASWPGRSRATSRRHG